MKKIILSFVLVLSIFVITSCKEKTTNYKEVTILSPLGTPALSQMYVQEKCEEYNYKIDLVQGSDALSAAFLTKSYDFIYAPLNLGAKMYINNQNYKLLATVVDCNYYFVAKVESELTISDIASKQLVIFGENAMSGILARYILENNKYNLDDLNITYVSSVADSMSAFIQDQNQVVLLSEPQISTLLNKVEGLKLFSVKEEYTRLSGNQNAPQAAVFVRNGLDKDIVNKYSSYLKDSIQKVNQNIEGSATLGSTLYSNFTKEVLINAIPRSEIVYTSAVDAKEKCELFFELLNNYNPKILGGAINDEFYYN